MKGVVVFVDNDRPPVRLFPLASGGVHEYHATKTLIVPVRLSSLLLLCGLGTPQKVVYDTCIRSFWYPLAAVSARLVQCLLYTLISKFLRYFGCCCTRRIYPGPAHIDVYTLGTVSWVFLVTVYPAAMSNGSYPLFLDR